MCSDSTYPMLSGLTLGAHLSDDAEPIKSENLGNKFPQTWKFGLVQNIYVYSMVGNFYKPALLRISYEQWEALVCL